MGYYTEEHTCRKHGPYTCTIWCPKPTCPVCWQEREEARKKRRKVRRKSK